MSPLSSTEKLANKPDAALKAIIAEVQDQALRTQSEAYRLVFTADHPDIDATDVIEVRCAPDPAIRVTQDGTFPQPSVWCGGFILEQAGELYRCWHESVRRGKKLPDADTLQEASDDPALSIEPAGQGDPYDWELTRWSWQKIDPSFAQRTVQKKTDAQVRAFTGAVLDDQVTVHPEMAFGVLGAPKQN